MNFYLKSLNSINVIIISNYFKINNEFVYLSFNDYIQTFKNRVIISSYFMIIRNI